MWHELKNQLERDCKFGARHKSKRALLLMTEYEKRATQQHTNTNTERQVTNGQNTDF